MKTVRRLLLMALLTSPLVACEDAATHPLRFEDARVRLPVPGSDKSVGYFTVTNTSDSVLVLTGASSPGVRAIEIHTMMLEGDMMRMRRLEDVTVAPGETVSFEPGGKHLMMFGVDTLPARVPLTFTDGAGVEHVHVFDTFSATD